MNLRTPTVRVLAAAAVTCAALVAAAVPAAALVVPGAARAPAVAGAAKAAVATAPACATSGLDVWLDTQGSGAAGTIYYNLEFTNLSGSTCTLYGYPGVSGTTLGGTQLGSPAARVGATPATVTLANGGTATALVGIVQPGIIPASQCQPATAAGLRVYPPGQTASRRVPFPFGACSKAGPAYLKIYPVE
jgi:hypothetical protein